ncbi:unnamed protein product [Rotaria sp. Silwood1]|nr:unnamed protein product [Rotaria sp. Silwood1]CAF1469559.1 unnamed protein product [Rotaria sp. Silwood1]
MEATQSEESLYFVINQILRTANRRKLRPFFCLFKINSYGCQDPSLCLSKWGYCGTGSAYCDDGCQAGPCTGNGGGNGGSGSVGDIDSNTFACVFNTIDSTTRTDRFNGLKASGWKPQNKEEAAVFLAHVFHETDGLKTMREYCAPGILF